MQERLQGSFPRRFFKRTHNRNPTFHSYNILGLISPDPMPQNTAKQVIPAKDIRGRSFFFNGEANEQFQLRKKHSVGQYDPPSSLKSSRRKQEDPQIREETMKGLYMAPRSKSTNKIELDSLIEAESLFAKNKLRNPFNYISQQKFMSQSKVGPSMVDISPYKNSRTICEKQKADYNIITNMPRF